jgi:hypothetical protein
MTAKIVQLADAVTAALAEAEFSVEFVPERSYADWTMQLEDSDTLHVDVVIVGHEASELDDRGDIAYVDAIDIGVRYKFGPEAREPDGRLRNADVDGLVALVEEIHESLAAERLDQFEDAIWRDASIRATYVRQHLREWGQFTAILRISFDLLAELTE